MNPHSFRLKLGAAAVALVLGLSAGVAPVCLQWIDDTRATQEQAERRLGALARVRELLLEAEAAQRGYLLTGQDGFLQSYQQAAQQLPTELQRLENRHALKPASERDAVGELLRHALLQLREMAETVELRQSGGAKAAEPVAGAAQGKLRMDTVRRLAAEIAHRDGRERAEAEEDLQARIRWGFGLSLAGMLTTLLLVGSLARAMLRALRQREQSAAQARLVTEQMEAGMTALQRHNGEMRILGEMSRTLQADMTLNEELEVTALFCARLLPGTSGAIFLLRPAANQLEPIAGWGADQRPESPMAPGTCWGVRLGQVHRSSEPGELRCRHCEPPPGMTPPSGEYHLCLPLMAYGEVLGLMHLRGVASAAGAAAVNNVEATARAISEQAALSLANAKLRQTLRDQSVRDPLTGLYNRRYMEETLLRELMRAQRNRTCVSLVIVDLDHFKRINDSHGHLVGDAVLRATAHQLGAMVRASDVASRYGGEEFVVVLVDCNKDCALAKAEQMRTALRALTITEEGHVLHVTASFGVASAPVDGTDPKLLMAAADRALYEAKRLGRDRVVGSGAPGTALALAAETPA